MKRIIMSLDEFRKEDKDKNFGVEYIDGYAYFLDQPATEHERILSNLTIFFNDYFSDNYKDLHVGRANLWLEDKEMAAINKVIPDICIIPDHFRSEKDEFRGTPSLIVEITSTESDYHDRLRKYEMYMNYGIYEFWLINPLLRTIEIYVLRNGEYKQAAVHKGAESVFSIVYPGFSFELNKLFTKRTSYTFRDLMRIVKEAPGRSDIKPLEVKSLNSRLSRTAIAKRRWEKLNKETDKWLR